MDSLVGVLGGVLIAIVCIWAACHFAPELDLSKVKQEETV